MEQPAWGTAGPEVPSWGTPGPAGPPGSDLASAGLLDVLGELPSIVVSTDHVESGHGIFAGSVLLARLSRDRPSVANRFAGPLVPTRHLLTDRQDNRVAELTRPGRLEITDGYRVTGVRGKPIGAVRRTRPATGQIRISGADGRTLRLQADGTVDEGAFKVVDEQDRGTRLAGIRRRGSYRVDLHPSATVPERLLIAVAVICLDQVRHRP